MAQARLAPRLSAGGAAPGNPAARRRGGFGKLGGPKKGRGERRAQPQRTRTRTRTPESAPPSPAPQRSAYASFSSCRCRPSPSISSSTTSPDRRYGFGSGCPMATPAGVPVLMTSPGYSVMNRLT